jgi:hypothetical protein
MRQLQVARPPTDGGFAADANLVNPIAGGESWRDFFSGPPDLGVARYGAWRWTTAPGWAGAPAATTR